MSAKNKRIGILTYHQCHNVGAMLGAYALQHKVDDLGYSSEYIDYVNPIYIEHGKKAGHNLYRRTDEEGLKYQKLYEQELRNRWDKFEDFYHRYLNLSKEVGTDDEIIKQLECYDLILIGGDQLWNTNLEVASDLYTIPYQIKAKCISFGTSMGDATELPNKKIQELKKFSFIAVREKEAAEYLKKFTNVRIEVVPDVIFLLGINEWKKIAKAPNKKNYIFAYLFCRNYEIFYRQINELADLSRQTGMEIVVCATDGFETFPGLIPVVDVGPIEWLGYMLHSDYVITNSFHGLAFSIKFNKNFMCLDSDRRKYNLASEYGLEKYLNRSIADYEALSKIDYKRINLVLERKKEKAFMWLKDSLRECIEG